MWNITMSIGDGVGGCPWHTPLGNGGRTVRRWEWLLKINKGHCRDLRLVTERSLPWRGTGRKQFPEPGEGVAIRIGPLHRSYNPWCSDPGSMATWPKGPREIYRPPSSPPTCPSPLDKPKGKPESRGSREHRIPDLRSASSGTGLGGRVTLDVQGKQSYPGPIMEYWGKTVHTIFPSWKAVTLKVNWAQEKPQRALKPQFPGNFAQFPSWKMS